LKQIAGSSFAPFNQCRELDLANSPFIDGHWRARFDQTSDLLLDCITLAQPISKGIPLHLTPPYAASVPPNKFGQKCGGM
jgi:hypothetical protein